MNVKNVIGFALIVFLTIGITACGGKEKSVDKVKTQPQNMADKEADQSHAMVKLPTVQCGTCKETIESGLRKIDGIVSVNVDIEGKMGHINFDSDQVDLETIEKAIASLGYQANETMADINAYSKLPMCCKLPEDRD